MRTTCKHATPGPCIINHGPIHTISKISQIKWKTYEHDIWRISSRTHVSIHLWKHIRNFAESVIHPSLSFLMHLANQKLTVEHWIPAMLRRDLSPEHDGSDLCFQFVVRSDSNLLLKLIVHSEDEFVIFFGPIHNIAPSYLNCYQR